MPNVLIEEENASDAVQTAKTKDKKDATSRAIITSILIVVVIILIFGIMLLARKISQKTQELQQNPTRSEGGPGGLNIPSPGPGLALPGLGAGASGAPAQASSGPPAPENMVLVPAGDYIQGFGDNGAPVKIPVPAFFIDKYEVTNQQYADFVKATGHRPPMDPRGPRYSIWKNGTFPTELANHPVVDVSYQDAADYAKWLDKRLPTEEEWERACRGDQGFVYPWGNDFNPASANCSGNPAGKGGTMPVGSFPADCSPFGVYDMAGNVREWTSTPYTSGSEHWKVVKGGSFEDGADGLSSFTQHKGTTPAPDLGFRCAKDAG